MALGMCVYNLITKRQSLKGKTPAHAAGITKRPRLLPDIVAMIDADFKGAPAIDVRSL